MAQSGVTAERIVESGLQRIIFTTGRGSRILVNLPQDLRAGETCTGSVFGEASGKTDAERAAANDELRNYVVEIAGQKISSTGKTFELSIPAAGMNGDISRVVLRDQKGKEVARAEFKVSAQATSRATDFRLPTAQLGEMIQVECPCDGIMADTDHIRIGGQESLPIAESPRMRWAFNTNPAKGAKEIEVSERGQVIKGKISVLGIRLSALKTDLLKGEQTTLTIEVSGLEDVKEAVPLRLENKTPDVLTMAPSNIQELTIKPAEVRVGKYTTQRTLTGIRVGNFLIEGTVVRREQPVGNEAFRGENALIMLYNYPQVSPDDNKELARLIEEDQADRTPPTGKPLEWAAIASRHRERLARVREFSSQNRFQTGNDYYRAALMLLRGDGLEDYRLGQKLSAVATTKRGNLQLLQTGPEQDCNGGIPVCQGTFQQTQSYTGVGTVQESTGTCLGGESNSVWYILTTQSTGSLTFTISTPQDYDFALYNITNSGCPGVPGSTPIRCNYSGTPGNTGLVSPTQAELPALSVSATGPPTMAGVNVTAGQKYALVVNNYTGDQNGYTLTIGGTATFADASIPTLTSASLDAAQCAVDITVSEPVRCSSIAANGSDFLLSVPGGGAVVTGASGVGCGIFTNKIRLTYSLGNADACGAWTIASQTGTDGNTLIDNCNNQLATGGTVTLATPPPAVAHLVMPGEVFCEGAPIIADGSGSTGEIRHFWSVVESDANWNVIGTEHSAWFSGPASTLDVGQFAAQQGFTLACGKYYRVKVAVQNCCTNWSESVQLIRIQCPPVADAGPDRTVCCCGPVKMQIGSPAVTGVTYSWSPTIGLDDPTSSSPTIDFSIFNGTSVAFPSVYEVTATDAFGCSSKDSVFIKTVCSCRPPAKVSVTRPNICARTFTLTADCACGDTTATYLWSPGGATTQSIEVPAGSGPYSVTCRNECGATVSQPIIVPPATPLEGGFPSIQCPNVFTPNGDGVNDFWVVLDPQLVGATPAYNATDYQFEVFDRWGSTVVLMSGSTTTGFANGSIPHWDGTANQNALYSWWQHLWGKKDTSAGANLSDGTYYYILRMKNCTTGWTDICVGFVTILR